MKYSDYCHTGLLDSELNILYCSNKRIFRLMFKSGLKVRRNVLSAPKCNTVFHSFKADGVMCLARFDMLNDNFWCCRVSEEIPEKYASDDNNIYKDIDNVKNGALSALSMAKSISEYITHAQYCEVNEYLEEHQRCVSDIYSNCVNLLELFDRKSESGFIQLRRWLINTMRTVSYISAPTMKRISFFLCIEKPYAKLDFASLELSLFNLVRLALCCTCEGSSTNIDIFSVRNDTLRVMFSMPMQQNISLNRFRIEMRTVKHLFLKRGGHFDFFEQDGFIRGVGEYKVEYSSDPKVLRSTLEIESDLYEIIQKQKTGKFKRLYTVIGKNVLRSPRLLLDETDPQLEVTKKFFLGVI